MKEKDLRIFMFDESTFVICCFIYMTMSLKFHLANTLFELGKFVFHCIILRHGKWRLLGTYLNYSVILYTPGIFRSRGNQYFREFKSTILLWLTSSTQSVTSLVQHYLDLGSESVCFPPKFCICCFSYNWPYSQLIHVVMPMNSEFRIKLLNNDGKDSLWLLEYKSI